jgi:hypothetical protein
MDDLKPGIYGQTGIPPIVMIRDSPSREWMGPRYILSISENGECFVWIEGQGAKFFDYQTTKAIPYRYCRLATEEESALIKEW